MGRLTKVLVLALVLLPSLVLAFPGARVGHMSPTAMLGSQEITRIASNVTTTDTGTSTSFTTPITIPGGTIDVVLLMAATVVRGSSPTPTVTAVTYNGSATGVTLLTSITHATSLQTTYIYRLLDPLRDGTARNVVWSVDNAAWIVAGAVAYAHVDAVTPFGTPATAQAVSNAPSVTVSSAADDVVFAHCGYRDDDDTISTHASQTQIYNTRTAIAVASNGTGAAGSEEAGAASVVMSYTISASDSWTCAGVALKPM